MKRPAQLLIAEVHKASAVRTALSRDTEIHLASHGRATGSADADPPETSWSGCAPRAAVNAVRG
jgi:hypothetical protein